jgi:hypothetical protein
MMRKKLKKYNLGGTAPGGSFIDTLLGKLNSVPVDGQVVGNNILGGNIDPSMVASLAMRQYSNNNIPSNLMGDYRRGSTSALMNNGVPGQFNFMNSFMANNNLPGQPPPINTDPSQFMPQIGFNAQMDASDQALQSAGPINTAGPQFGMPMNPNTNMSAAPTIAPPTVTSSAYGTSMAKTGLAPTMNMQPFIDANTPAGTGTAGGSGLGLTNVESTLAQSVFNESNEFDQAKGAINQAKGTISTLKKVIGEDTFKSHGAKLLSKIPGKFGEKMATKVAEAGVKEAGTKFGTFLGSNAGAAASFGVGLLGKGIQELDKKDGNYSKAGAMGGGALQGAAIGSMLGPLGTLAGGAIGAGLGALQRKKFEQAAESQALTEKTILAKDNARTRLQSKQILANVPTQGIKDQIYEQGGLVDGGGKTPAKEKYIPEGSNITLDMINQYMTDTRSTADNPYDFSAAADTIAYHESSMDPQRLQMAGGPGRGAFQYDAPSAKAASNRLKDLATYWNKPNPEWNTVEGTKDFSKLSIEQQKMLWLADKLMDKTVDLKSLGMGEEPLKDFWADHHWRGADKDRNKRQLSFESHRLPAKLLGLPEYKAEAAQPTPPMDSVVPNMELPFNPAIIGSLPLDPTQFQTDTVKMKFELGGPAQGGPGGFLSRTLAGGVPDYMKNRLSTAPYKKDLTTIQNDGYSQYQSRGHNLALKELVELFKTAGRGKEGKKIIGIPTGRQ